VLVYPVHLFHSSRHVRHNAHAPSFEDRLIYLFFINNTFLLVFAFLFLDGGILVLLVLGDKILHVGFGFGELHLVHTLVGVPMEESLALEHSSELLADTLEQLLDGCGVTNEGNSHLETTGRNVALSSEDVVRDPLNEVSTVLVLDVLHLLFNFLHGDLATEVGGNGEVTTVTRVRGSHHVLSIEHLLRELWDSDGTVLLAATGGQWSETNHEEVQTGERNHVDGKLPQIGVELTRETQASGDTAHDDGDEVVQVTVCGGAQLQCAEANFVQGFVINAEGLVGVLDELMNGEGGVVGLDDGVRDLGRWDDRECAHHPVGILFPDLGDEEGTHTSTSTTTEGVSDLETLEAVSALGLLTDNIKNGID